MTKDYNSSYGLWKVTTEGDCEGRTTRTLGIYAGNISDIAFYLKDKCEYSLNFSPAPVIRVSSEDVLPHGKVTISLPIDSGTWNMSPEDRVNYFTVLLNTEDEKDRFSVDVSNYYASVELTGRMFDDSLEVKVKNALDKLTDEEKTILGLRFL